LARRITTYVLESIELFCLEELQHTVPETIRNILARRIITYRVYVHQLLEYFDYKNYNICSRNILARRNLNYSLGSIKNILAGRIIIISSRVPGK